MPKIQINNVELHYEKYGMNGIPIVFVHGFLASSTMWHDYFIPHLPKKYRAFTIDMRGHGQSHRVKHGCNVKQLSDDVCKFVQQLQLEKILYVGMSMGGAVGIQLALDHPDILRALILMNTGFGTTISKSSRFITSLVKLMAQRRWILKMFIKRLFTRPPNNEFIQAFLDDAILVSQETWIEYVHYTNRINQLQLLGNFEAPTLVMIGAKDHVIPPEKQTGLVDIIPNSKKIVFENEGHAMFIENPEAIFKEMMLFLEEHTLC